MKKIAVPIANREFCTHFGGAEAFAFFTVDETGKAVSTAEILTPPPHERGAFPVWLRSQGVTAVLAGGMGPRASSMLVASGIDVVLGIQGGHPETLAREYLAGRLTSVGSLCAGGGLHGCAGHEHEV